MGCYGRAVPGPRCYGPRGHAGLLAAGIFASRAAARARAREVRHRSPNIFSFALKLNSITSTCLLTPEAERWLQIAQSRPPPSRNFGTGYARRGPSLKKSVGQKGQIRFWPSHNSCYEVVMLAVITTSGRCYECYEVL